MPTPPHQGTWPPLTPWPGDTLSTTPETCAHAGGQAVVTRSKGEAPSHLQGLLPGPKSPWDTSLVHEHPEDGYTGI